MAMILAVVVLMSMVKFVNDTVNETVNTSEQSTEKSYIMRTGESFLNGINEKGWWVIFENSQFSWGHNRNYFKRSSKLG